MGGTEVLKLIIERYHLKYQKIAANILGFMGDQHADVTILDGD